MPGAPRRRRALVLLLVAPAVSSAANTTALAPRSVPCAPASTSTANALTSQSCSDACGLNSLCVFRTHAPSSCAVDCVPTEAAATTWTAKWLEDQPNGRAAVVVASAASNDDAESTVVVHDSVTRIADQLTLPTSVMHISLTGPTTSPLMKFSLSDGMRSSFASLRYLALTKVSVSDWKTLPTMPTLRNLSLNDVALDWWPNATSFDVLEALSLDNNPLPASLPTLPVTLRTLSLQSIGITELPSSLSNLTMLRNLFLGGNKIPKITIVNLPKSLQTLSMRDCALDSFPGNVELPPGLIALDLSDNPGIQLSTNTTALSGLRELRLAGCGIKTLSAVPPMNRELGILDLSSNPLADTDDTVSTQLAALPNLSSLDLSATDRRRVADAIATMTQLRHLSLASNKILTVDAASLPPSLQHLNIAYNDKAMALSVPPALLSLNVSNCGLTSLTPAVPLSKLESLDASGNALESNDLPPNVLPPTLMFLNLSNNRLTTFPTAVFELPSLQHLDLRGNPIPSGALASLSAAHVAFLNGLQSLYVDPSVFQSSDCGASVATFSFGYTVCIIAASAADKRNNDPAAEAAGARARARINRNLTVIAITIGTALVLVTLMSLVMRRRRSRTRARALHSSKRDGMLLTGTAAQTDGAWPTELASDREMTDAEWRALQMWSFWDDEDVLQLRVPWDLVRDRQVIGSGQYSVLWLARVATQPVFLKALQPTAHRSDDLNDEGAVAAVAALMREIQVLRFVRHPQIVRLVGVTWLNSPTDVQLAIEDMANGDLRGYLELTQPPAPPSRWRSDGLAMRVALAIAEALVFLHACGVAHNDLRSRNVVLDDDCHAKLTGFGRHVFVAPVEDEDEEQEHNLCVDAVARAAATAAQRDQHVPPPRVDHTFLIEAGRWMAPEVLRRHLRGRQRSLRSRSAASSTTTTTTTSATAAASPAADVYAFGVLLLELDAFEMPFERIELDVDVHDWRPRDDSTSDDDDAWEKRPPARDVAPSAASDLRFSSMPSGHNSLLGGGATLLQPTMPSTPPSKFAEDATAMGGGTTLLHAAEEKCELALLRRLADGAVQAEATPSCPAGVRDLIRQCMALRPESRPSMKVVRDALRAIASQRHRSSTGGSSANVNSNCTTIDSSRRGGGRGGHPAAAAQTGDEDRAGVAGSSSASSDTTATTAFFVMHHTPTHRSVTPLM